MVDNRAGAAGNIAADIVAKAPADGYTMLMSNSTIAIPSLYAKLPFDVVRDFIPLSLIALGPSVLVVHPSIGVNDVKGLIALAKAKPKQLAYGSGGLGNYTHLAMELFASMAGVDMVHVPYKGGAPSVVGLISGEVQLLFTLDPRRAAADQCRQDEAHRRLDLAAEQRTAQCSDHRRGGFARLLRRFVVRASAAGRRAEGRRSIRWRRKWATIMRIPAIKEQMLKEGFEPVGSTSLEFTKFIREEIPRWDKIVKTAGIKPQ